LHLENVIFNYFSSANNSFCMRKLITNDQKNSNILFLQLFIQVCKSYVSLHSLLQLSIKINDQIGHRMHEYAFPKSNKLWTSHEFLSCFLQLLTKFRLFLLHIKTSMYNSCIYVLCSSISTMINSFFACWPCNGSFYLIVF